MGKKCCMPGCTGNYKNGPNMHVFRFPKNEEMRMKWIQAIRRKRSIPLKYTTVCHLHFKDEEVKWTSNILDDITVKIISYELLRPQLVPDPEPSILHNCPDFASSTAVASRDCHAGKEILSRNCPETKKIIMAIEVSIGADGKNVFKMKYFCDICKGIYSSLPTFSNPKSRCIEQKSTNNDPIYEILITDLNDGTEDDLNPVNPPIDSSICNIVTDSDDEGLPENRSNQIPVTTLVEDGLNSNNSAFYEPDSSDKNVVNDSDLDHHTENSLTTTLNEVCKVLDKTYTRKSLYPRICEFCGIQYKNKYSFYGHKKACTGYIVKSKPKIVYPRTCLNCKGRYRSSQSFSRHKQKCNTDKCSSRLIHDNSDINIIPDSNLELRTGNCRINSDVVSKLNDENKNNTYPRNCGILLKNKYSSFYHKNQTCGIPKKSSIYPRICEYCQNKYNSKSSFSYHKKTCGKPKKRPIYPRTCESCKVQCKTKMNFFNHKKICGRVKKKKKVPGPIFCPKCSLTLSSKSTLYRHQKHFCKGNKKIYRVSCYEPNCKAVFSTYMTMINHVNIHHETNSNADIMKSITFDSYSKFVQWKDTELINNPTSMVKISGSKSIKNVTYEYYICQFEAARTYTSKHLCLTNRRRKLGRTPYIACPVRMFVRITDKNVNVKYITQHSHSIGSLYKRLPASIRNMVRSSTGSTRNLIQKFENQNLNDKPLANNNKTDIDFPSRPSSPTTVYDDRNLNWEVCESLLTAEDHELSLQNSVELDNQEINGLSIEAILKQSCIETAISTIMSEAGLKIPCVGTDLDCIEPSVSSDISISSAQYSSNDHLEHNNLLELEHSYTKLRKQTCIDSAILSKSSEKELELFYTPVSSDSTSEDSSNVHLTQDLVDLENENMERCNDNETSINVFLETEHILSETVHSPLNVFKNNLSKLLSITENNPTVQRVLLPHLNKSVNSMLRLCRIVSGPKKRKKSKIILKN